MERQTEHPHEHAATDPMEASVQAEAHVTISDAARMTGASRTRLYRAIDGGRIQRSADGKVSIQSLLHAGFELKDGQPSATAPRDNLSYLLTHYTDMARQLNDSLEAQIDALQEQLRFLQEQLRLSQQREAQLWQMLQAERLGMSVPSPVPPDVSCEVSPEDHEVLLDKKALEAGGPKTDLWAAGPPGGEQPNRLAEPEVLTASNTLSPTIGLFGWRRPKS
jgi:Tfp pilus assembly protein FimV